MFFKKRKSGEEYLTMDAEQFCTVREIKSDDVTNKYCIIASSDHYCLLYRDGQFLGMPCPFGGAIYPFSTDPTKQGSNGDKKRFHRAKVVCLTKDFNLKVYWGTETPFVIEDTKTHLPYSVGARGVFYVNIDPNDAARKADKFYSKCLSQGNASLYDTEKLRDFLKEAFIMQIGGKIQEYIAASGRSLESYMGLQPSDILKVSQDICPTVTDIFAEYGLCIVKKSSQGSILQGLVVNPFKHN